MIIKTEGGHTFKVEDVLCLAPSGHNNRVAILSSGNVYVPLTEAEYAQILRVMEAGQVTYPAATVAEGVELQEQRILDLTRERDEWMKREQDQVKVFDSIAQLLQDARRLSGYQLPNLRTIIERLVSARNSAMGELATERHERLERQHPATDAVPEASTDNFNAAILRLNKKLWPVSEE